MKIFLALIPVLISFNAHANLKFSFQNEEIGKVIDIYSKATGQKFVIDPSVRGRTTIEGADNVSNEEAFNLLSTALATNDYAISKQDDVNVIMPVRRVARDLVETYTTLPTLKPQRYAGYMIQLKNISVDEVNKNMRFLPSKDGEMNAMFKTNTLIIFDWTSNLQKIDQVLKELDKPVDPKIAKVVAAAQAEREKHHQEMFPNNARGMKAEVPKGEPSTTEHK